MRNPLVSFLFLPPLLLISRIFVNRYLDGLFEELALLQTIAYVVFESDEIFY